MLEDQKSLVKVFGKRSEMIYNILNGSS